MSYPPPLGGKRTVHSYLVVTQGLAPDSRAGSTSVVPEVKPAL
ncbi:hypothetical protein [Hymenobacter sp. UV11]|nr:hypothetical protein [Hymenobacter sp. UV11]